MEIMIIAYEDPSGFESRHKPEELAAYMKPWSIYAEEMAKAGVLVKGEALEGPETATVVSVRNGKRIVQDGPFADSKEQIGGFFIVDVDDVETAAKWASKCPSTPLGCTEARTIAKHGEE